VSIVACFGSRVHRWRCSTSGSVAPAAGSAGRHAVALRRGDVADLHGAAGGGPDDQREIARIVRWLRVELQPVASRAGEIAFDQCLVGGDERLERSGLHQQVGRRRARAEGAIGLREIPMVLVQAERDEKRLDRQPCLELGVARVLKRGEALGAEPCADPAGEIERVVDVLALDDAVGEQVIARRRDRRQRRAGEP
jgi:hypothetical protein